MRYHCHMCGESVTSELPEDAVIRAALICPECLQNGSQQKLDEAFKSIEEKLREGYK